MRLRGNNEFHVIYRSFTLFLWKWGQTGDKISSYWGQINRALVCKQKGRKGIVLLFLYVINKLKELSENLKIYQFLI